MTEDGAITIRSVELREVALPLVRPFRTSFGEESEKRCVLVRIETTDQTGWGRCQVRQMPACFGAPPDK